MTGRLRNPWRRRLAFAALLCLSIVAASRPQAPPIRLRWVESDGISLALAGPSGEVWRLNYGPDLDHAYFHPLSTPEGTVLTADKPADHIWHHGLWFSWKYINGVNYWEVEPKTGHPAGRTSWTRVIIENRPDFSAHIALDLDYRPVGEARPVLAERRSIEISAPGDTGIYALDWTSVFTASTDLVFGRTPMPGEPGGQVNGGYAGLAVRLAVGLLEREPITSDGPVGEMKNDRYRGNHIGMDYSGLADGRPAGIAVLDHPANPRSPSPWYVVRSAAMSFFNPALLSPAVLSLRAGEKMTLRYRILIHPGRWDAARLRAEHKRYARGS